MSVDVTKLPSGLTVITDTMPHLETAALGVWAGVGGRDEKPDEHGISHLLEHMAFKGTSRRSSRDGGGGATRLALIRAASALKPDGNGSTVIRWRVSFSISLRYAFSSSAQ